MDLFLPRPDPPSGGASPDTAPWWVRPGELRKELATLDDAGGRELTFAFGGGHLRLASNDPRIAERFYRDVRVYRIYEGTSQIMQIVIAKAMLKAFERM